MPKPSKSMKTVKKITTNEPRRSDSIDVSNCVMLIEIGAGASKVTTNRCEQARPTRFHPDQPARPNSATRRSWFFLYPFAYNSCRASADLRLDGWHWKVPDLEIRKRGASTCELSSSDEKLSQPVTNNFLRPCFTLASTARTNLRCSRSRDLEPIYNQRS